MPMPNHCIECDKPATVFENKIPFCSECATKNIKTEPTTADPFNKESNNGKRDNKKNIQD